MAPIQECHPRSYITFMLKVVMPTISIWILNFVEYIELFLLSIVIKSTMKKTHYIVHGPVQQFSTAFFDQPWLHSLPLEEMPFLLLVYFQFPSIKSKGIQSSMQLLFYVFPLFACLFTTLDTKTNNLRENT